MVNQMRQRYPDLAILPAHDPGAADRLSQASGQASDSGGRIAVPGTKMAIDTLESIPPARPDNGSASAYGRSNPPLLLIQQGPGLPMINETRRYGRVLGLEQYFTVIYWDQRGCGRSLRGTQEPAGISLKQMVADTVSVLGFLRDRFGGRTCVAGFSFGATLAAFAAAQRPDLVRTLVATGMDIDGAAAANGAYQFALRTAKQRGSRRATRQLEAIGPPPHLTSKQFGTRVRWASNFGGVTTGETYASLARELVSSLVRCSDYSAGDIIRTVRGITATQAALLPDLASMDLTRSLPALTCRRHGAGAP